MLLEILSRKYLFSVPRLLVSSSEGDNVINDLEGFHKLFSDCFQMKKKAAGFLCLCLPMTLVLLVAFSGPAFAGDLEPSGPPGPTMKTLNEIPPTWSQTLPAAERFELVMGNEAVLDKETGLVWEQSPSDEIKYWKDAVYYCYNKNVGNRGGWRLPAVEELRSLVDPTASNPALPDGHPFSIVQMSYHWTITTYEENSDYARQVRLSTGVVYNGNKTGEQSAVWCVRGGHGYDGP